MGLIGDADVLEIRKRLDEMVNPVRLIHFTHYVPLPVMCPGP